MNLTLLYRGPLESCNYGCRYCPFAKRREGRAALAADRAALERFRNWVAGRVSDRISILFTPWGEALVRPWYREAMVALSRMAPVAKVVAQTNLSGGLEWTGRADLSKLALWCSYHPSEVPRRRFLSRCRELLRRGVRFSVGAVGLKEHEEEIRALRRELPRDVYLWINAYKPHARYYVGEDVRRLEEIDPLFRINLEDHASGGRACRAGESVVSVDGDGTIRRCHFIPEPIGNLYGSGLEAALAPRSCTNRVCRCHIGYVHMPGLGLDGIFGSGALERIPEGWGQVSTTGS